MSKNLIYLKKKLKDFSSFCSEKSVSSLSGELAFFMFSGLVPFCCLLVKLLSYFGVSGYDVFSYLGFLFPEGKMGEQIRLLSISRGAAVFYIITSFWSATNFYYRLKKSGEHIFSIKKNRSKIILRIISFFNMLAVLFLFFSAVVFMLLQQKLFNFLSISFFYGVISIISQAAVFFALTVSLVKISAPLKIPFCKITTGCLLIFAAWEIINLLFSAYNMLFPNAELLVTVTFFMFYLYFMCYFFYVGLCFISVKLSKEYVEITDRKLNIKY